LNEQEWREANRERAKERVVRSLVLHEFAHREGIEVEESEVESEIDKMVNRLEVEEADKARELFSADNMRSNLENQVYQRKLLDRLTGIAEGRIEAAPPPVEDDDEEKEKADGSKAKKEKADKADKASDEEAAAASATAMEAPEAQA